MTGITETLLEETCLEWLDGLGWTVLHGSDLAPGILGQEREDYRQILLESAVKRTA